MKGGKPNNNFIIITRAIIDLEPKIRTARKIQVYYLKRKQLFLFARLMLDHMFAYLPPGTICFSNVLFSTSFLESSRKMLFRLAYFLNQLKY